MNEKSVELAQLSLNSFVESVSPQYAQARQDLLAELAISGARLNGDRLLETQGAANYRLITNFVDLLPHSYGGELITNKPFAARAAIASSLWLGEYDRFEPHYIVGSNPEGEVLLAVPGRGANSNMPEKRLAKLALKKSESKNLIQQGNLIYSQPTREDVEEMFNLKDNLLHITSSTQGVTKIKNSLAKNATARLEPISWVSDLDLIAFNTDDHLNNLATLFEKANQLEKLLEEAAVN